MVDWNAIDWNVVVQAILFGLFAAGTAILNLVIQPTYDNLVVPGLSSPSLFPSLSDPSAGAGFLSTAVRFSEFLLGNLVDPAVVLVLLGMAGLYLIRAFSTRVGRRLEPLLPRFIIGLIAANFTLPIVASALDLGGATFRLVASFDGGAWRHWANIAPVGGSTFSWDNGVLAFVVSFALFALVLTLAVVVALRDAMIAVLVVLLPLFTLLWVLPPLATLARRGWTLLLELVFVPSVMLVPLELAVGSPSILFVLAYLAIAVGSPYLVSIAGSHLGGIGFPGAGGVLGGGVQRGLTVASLSIQDTANVFGPGRPTAAGSGVASSLRGVVSQLGKGSVPGGVVLGAGHLVSQGTRQLLRHVRPSAGSPVGIPAHSSRLSENRSARVPGGVV